MLERGRALCVRGTLILVATWGPSWVRADEPIAQPPSQALVIGGVGTYGRTAFFTDAVEALRVAGTLGAPRADDTVTRPDGQTRAWETVSLAADGVIRHDALKGGYAFLTVTARRAGPMLLEASGHGMVFVNGEPRVGDGYRTGFVRLPVALRAGENSFLFYCHRGEMQVRLSTPDKPVFLDSRDATAPDLLVGEPTQTWAALLTVNATSEPLRDYSVQAAVGDNPATTTPVPLVPPFSVRKVAVRLAGAAPQEPGTATLRLALGRIQDADTPLDQASLTLRIRGPGEPHHRTFISDIDGSVQYYAVLPAGPDQTASASESAPRPALVLTLHGAGVEASSQANSYAQKPWAHIVAPTNRRPYGFDWEDWGREDALEVLRHVRRLYPHDPARTYLTGHSMGGHGVWSLAAAHPGRFAAIGPSAGWISFASYTGAGRYGGPVGDILTAAALTSDPLQCAANYAPLGIYILHGEKDDNVPVEQSREMRRQLGRFHRDLVYHEQPDAGHWWDDSPEAGVGCVDWGPMFEFFDRRRRPEPAAVDSVEFTTLNPATSPELHWLRVEAQSKPLRPSHVRLSVNAAARCFSGSTENVAALSLDVAFLAPPAPLNITLDDQELKEVAWPSGEPRLYLLRDARTGAWRVAEQPSPERKGPHRGGPFKQVFANRAVLVYGTRGGDAENAWAFAKARYDAETFWYRGNGTLTVIPDTAFGLARYPDQSVVLYGNADTNAAWSELLAGSPVTASNGAVQVGRRTFTGENLGCLFIRPRRDSDRALVGVVGGSGLVGMRSCDRLAYFVSGVHYPDAIVFLPEVFRDGARGALAAGFFGTDWTIESGDFAFRDPQ